MSKKENTHLSHTPSLLSRLFYSLTLALFRTKANSPYRCRLLLLRWRCRRTAQIGAPARGPPYRGAGERSRAEQREEEENHGEDKHEEDKQEEEGEARGKAGARQPIPSLSLIT